MTKKQAVICHNCGNRWTVDLGDLTKPDQVVVRDHNKNRVRIERFCLRCPKCNSIGMLEITSEEEK